MCVKNLSKVALDSAAAGTDPAISSRKSDALTTTPPSHTLVGELLRTRICATLARNCHGPATRGLMLSSTTGDRLQTDRHNLRRIRATGRQSRPLRCCAD